jgi:hypothetical protein
VANNNNVPIALILTRQVAGRKSFRFPACNLRCYALRSWVIIIYAFCVFPFLKTQNPYLPVVECPDTRRDVSRQPDQKIYCINRA